MLMKGRTDPTESSENSKNCQDVVLFKQNFSNQVELKPVKHKNKLTYF